MTRLLTHASCIAIDPPYPWRNTGPESSGPPIQRQHPSFPSPSNHSSTIHGNTTNQGGSSYPHRMSDDELMQRVGLRSELDPKAVALFRAAGDYLALLGEDPFRGPGRLPLNINEREELEIRTFGVVAYGSRLGSNSRPSPSSSSLQTPQQQRQPLGRGVGGPPFSRGSGSYDGEGRDVRGWDDGHGRSSRQEEQQFGAASYRHRDRSRSRDRSRAQRRSRSRERMYPDQS